MLDGANVHVSMVGFDDGSEHMRVLDGRKVPSINSNLTATADVTAVRQLKTNKGVAFIGTTKKAPFDVPTEVAAALLLQANPNGSPSSDVMFPYANGMTITRRDEGLWIVDFEERSMQEGACYEAPFEHVRKQVYPLRKFHREPRQQQKWWLLARSCPDMQAAIRA